MNSYLLLTELISKLIRISWYHLFFPTFQLDNIKLLPKYQNYVSFEKLIISPPLANGTQKLLNFCVLDNLGKETEPTEAGEIRFRWNILRSPSFADRAQILFNFGLPETSRKRAHQAAGSKMYLLYSVKNGFFFFLRTFYDCLKYLYTCHLLFPISIMALALAFGVNQWGPKVDLNSYLGWRAPSQVSLIHPKYRSI